MAKHERWKNIGLYVAMGVCGRLFGLVGLLVFCAVVAVWCKFKGGGGVL